MIHLSGHFLLYLTPGICEYQGHKSSTGTMCQDPETLKRNFYTIVASVISNSESIFSYCEIIEKPESYNGKRKKRAKHL